MKSEIQTTAAKEDRETLSKFLKSEPQIKDKDQ